MLARHRPQIATLLCMIMLGIGACDSTGQDGEPCESADECADELECIEGYCGELGMEQGIAASATAGESQSGLGHTMNTGDTCTTTGVVDMTSGPTTAMDANGAGGSTTGPAATTGADHGDSSGSTGGGDATGDEGCSDVPPQFHASNPFDSADARAIAAGKATYDTSCGFCHGESAQGGTSPPGTALNDDRAASRPDCFYLWKISEGVPPSMPGFTASLEEAQIWQIVSYLRSLQP